MTKIIGIGGAGTEIAKEFAAKYGSELDTKVLLIDTEGKNIENLQKQTRNVPNIKIITFGFEHPDSLLKFNNNVTESMHLYTNIQHLYEKRDCDKYEPWLDRNYVGQFQTLTGGLSRRRSGMYAIGEYNLFGLRLRGDDIKQFIQDNDKVFIIVGLGGGTGSGLLQSLTIFMKNIRSSIDINVIGIIPSDGGTPNEKRNALVSLAELQYLCKNSEKECEWYNNLHYFNKIFLFNLGPAEADYGPSLGKQKIDDIIIRFMYRMITREDLLANTPYFAMQDRIQEKGPFIIVNYLKIDNPMPTLIDAIENRMRLLEEGENIGIKETTIINDLIYIMDAYIDHYNIHFKNMKKDLQDEMSIDFNSFIAKEINKIEQYYEDLKETEIKLMNVLIDKLRNDEKTQGISQKLQESIEFLQKIRNYWDETSGDIDTKISTIKNNRDYFLSSIDEEIENKRLRGDKINIIKIQVKRFFDNIINYIEFNKRYYILKTYLDHLRDKEDLKKYEILSKDIEHANEYVIQFKEFIDKFFLRDIVTKNRNISEFNNNLKKCHENIIAFDEKIKKDLSDSQEISTYIMSYNDKKGFVREKVRTVFGSNQTFEDIKDKLIKKGVNLNNIKEEEKKYFNAQNKLKIFRELYGRIIPKFEDIKQIITPDTDYHIYIRKYIKAATYLTTLRSNKGGLFEYTIDLNRPDYREESNLILKYFSEDISEFKDRRANEAWQFIDDINYRNQSREAIGRFCDSQKLGIQQDYNGHIASWIFYKSQTNSTVHTDLQNKLGEYITEYSQHYLTHGMANIMPPIQPITTDLYLKDWVTEMFLFSYYCDIKDILIADNFKKIFDEWDENDAKFWHEPYAILVEFGKVGIKPINDIIEQLGGKKKFKNKIRPIKTEGEDKKETLDEDITKSENDKMTDIFSKIV